MSKFNNDVIQAQEVVENYKKYNQQTKEVFSHYDPVLRIRVFKKVAIDPQAEVFKKKFIGKRREKKEDPEKKKPGRSKSVKPEVIQKSELSKPKAEPVMTQTMKDRIKVVKEMHAAGKTREDMAKRLDTSTNNITKVLTSIGLRANYKKGNKNEQVLKALQDFCTKNKINFFYTAYIKYYRIDIEKKYKYLTNSYREINESGDISLLKENCGTRMGNCYRVFNNPEFSDDKLPIMNDACKIVYDAIKEYCLKNKTNIFYGTYAKELITPTGLTDRVLETRIIKLTKNGFLRKIPNGLRRNENCYRVFDKGNFSNTKLKTITDDELSVLKEVKDFCNRKRQNFFYGRHSKEIGAKINFNRDKTNYLLNSLSVEGYIKKMKSGHNRGNTGNCYRIFNNKTYRDNI